jgi:pentatricopeptide repeat protein
LQEAIEVLPKMEQNGSKPNVVTYNTIVSALCKNGHLKTTKDLFEGVCRGGLLPDMFSYNTMIDGYAKAGNMWEVYGPLSWSLNEIG